MTKIKGENQKNSLDFINTFSDQKHYLTMKYFVQLLTIQRFFLKTQV